MVQANAIGNFARPRGELVVLFLASLVVVAALVIAVSDGGGIVAAGGQSRVVLLLCVGGGGAALAGAMALRALRQLSGTNRAVMDEVAELRRNLLTAEAIIKAEPQALIFWEQGHDVRVMVHSLSKIAGLPERNLDLLKFGQWLDVALHAADQDPSRRLCGG
jgi:hypothetical protein